MRYAFRFRPMIVSGRWASGVLLLTAVGVILLSQSLVGMSLSVAVAAVAGYFLVFPPSSDFYVETTGESLLIKRLWTTEISLEDIQTAEMWRPDYSPFMRGFMNFFLAFGNLWGGRNEMISEDEPPKDVMVRFSRWILVFTLLPPFIIPRKNWLLIVEDAQSLTDDLNRRISAQSNSTMMGGRR
jgi:hypothetical protein